MRTDGRTDGQTDMTKLIATFCTSANAPKVHFLYYIKKNCVSVTRADRPLLLVKTIAYEQ
jgi:hypothetical protein